MCACRGSQQTRCLMSGGYLQSMWRLVTWQTSPSTMRQAKRTHPHMHNCSSACSSDLVSPPPWTGIGVYVGFGDLLHKNVQKSCREERSMCKFFWNFIYLFLWQLGVGWWSWWWLMQVRGSKLRDSLQVCTLKPCVLTVIGGNKRKKSAWLQQLPPQFFMGEWRSSFIHGGWESECNFCLFVFLFCCLFSRGLHSRACNRTC